MEIYYVTMVFNDKKRQSDHDTHVEESLQKAENNMYNK